MAPRLGFIGMGLMGRAMTKNLVDHGNLSTPITLYNRTRTTAEEHCKAIGHAKVAASLDELIAESDIIWSCLQDETAVQSTFETILGIEIEGKLFVESSTITPDNTNSIAKKVTEAGGQFLALPVLGEPSIASLRLLICIAAGPPEALERVRPWLINVVGQAIIDLSGEEPGKASLLKLMSNVLILNTMQTVAEVNVFAEKVGLGVNNMEKLMSAMFPRPPHSVYNKRMLSGEYHMGQPIVEVSKAINLTSKVLQLAQSHGASVRAYEVAIQNLKNVETHRGPAADITGIYGAVRLESDLPFENDDSV